MERSLWSAAETAGATQSFYDRAQNVRDAIAHLQSHPAIQPNAIGVIGHSQGGWIGQLVAAQAADDVAFVISLAGPTISVREQLVDDVIGQWRCQGIPSLIQSLGRVGLHVGLLVYDLASRLLPIGYLGRIVAYDPREALGAISRGSGVRLPHAQQPRQPSAEAGHVGDDH